MVQPAPARRPVIECRERTDPGRDPNKQVNEDTCFSRETKWGYLLVVCDGMGGHAAGQEASRLALSTIFQMVDTAPDHLPPGQVLYGAIAEAGRAVHRFGGATGNPGRPGSTCVALLIHGGGTEVAHVGDSRAYVVRGAGIWPLTRDHSIVQQMIDARMITPDQAYGHPDANKITRALGMRPEVEVELRPEPMAHAAGDVFVLATDGLTDLVRQEELLGAVTSYADLDQAARGLVDLANSRGGHDNITVQLARVVDPGAWGGAAWPGAAPGPGASGGHAPPGPTLPQTQVSHSGPAGGYGYGYGYAPGPQTPAQPPAAPYVQPAFAATMAAPGAAGGTAPFMGHTAYVPGDAPHLAHGSPPMGAGAMPGAMPAAMPGAMAAGAMPTAAMAAHGAPGFAPPLAGPARDSAAGKRASSRGPIIIVVGVVVTMAILAAIVAWWVLLGPGDEAKPAPPAAQPTAQPAPARAHP